MLDDTEWNAVTIMKTETDAHEEEEKETDATTVTSREILSQISVTEK